MPVKLLPHLRFLSPSHPVASLPMRSTKVGPANSHRVATDILSRVFPFKLKYIGSGPSGTRRFSARARPGAGGASKSLIEDEAELSDWVSDLRTGSLRGGQATSDEDDDFGSRRGRGGSGRDRDTGRGRGREMGRVREGFSSKRRRDGEFSRVGKGFDDVEDKGRRDGEFSRAGKGFDDVADKRRRGGEFSRVGKRFDDLEDDRFGSRRKRGGGEEDGRMMRRDGKKLSGRGRGFLDDDDELLGKLKGRFDSQRSGYGRKNFGEGRKDFGGRRDGKVGSGGRGFLDDDEEEEVRKFGSDLGDFLRSENESDDDAILEKNAQTSLGLEDDTCERSVAGSPGATGSYLSESRFDQCTISPLSLKAVKDAGYEKMTVVQEATLPVILRGKDVLAKAKTGTGKTVAFLLPSIEVVVKAPPVSRDQKRPPILVLVICPTRELASQAAAEANKLLKYHTSIGVQVVIGGTRLALEQKRMQANPCQMLVATPGRLRDHIENTAGFATRLMGVKVLVLDEADHLLDMGFRKDIENIIAAVPKQRQTLLFSATVPDEVRQICHLALKRDHEYVNTVQQGTEETHEQVRQMHLVAPLEKHFPILYTLLKDHTADNADYKVLVFCTTAMVTRFVADLLGELRLNVREIHSRKPQSYRTRVSEEFRKSKGLILVTSDVSARGVDYPDVTLVVQVGLPADRQQYIHRLGRTGRKGKEGEGILLLAPWEEFFISTIKDLPITKGTLPSVNPDVTKKVERALSHVEMKNKEAAYQAWLGYYNSNKVVGRDKYKLVELANDFSRSMGLDNPPAIPKLVLGKMGLKNVPGLRFK